MTLGDSVRRSKAFCRGFRTIKAMTVDHTPLVESGIPDRPSNLLRTWISDAQSAKIPLPTVASLASASLPSGRVSSRMVNIKEVDPMGSLVVYSDFSSSRKGHDIKSNSHVALVFYWQQLDRSVRVEGKLNLLSTEESEPYFNSRGRDFQASVLVGPQTQPVSGGREELVGKIEKLKALPGDLKIPAFWTGAVISPDWIEFWQGNPDRISDRLAYTLCADGHWSIQRLSP